MASWRSGSTRTFPGRWKPASRSSRIWPGSSVRGLLRVRMTRSAPVSAISASWRRSGAVAASFSAQNAVDPAGGDGPHGGQGLDQGGRGLGRVDPDVEILTFGDRLEMSGDGLDRFQTVDDGVEVDLESPGQGRGGQRRGDGARADQGQVHRRLAVEAVEQHRACPSRRAARAGPTRQPGPFCRCERGSRLQGESDPPRVEVDSAQDLGVGVVGVDDRHAPRHDLAEQLGLGPPLGNQHLGRKAMGR